MAGQLLSGITNPDFCILCDFSGLEAWKSIDQSLVRLDHGAIGGLDQLVRAIQSLD